MVTEGWIFTMQNISPSPHSDPLGFVLKQYFSPSLRQEYQGTFLFFSFYMIQLPLFVRQELNVSDSHCNSHALRLVTRMHEPR